MKYKPTSITDPVRLQAAKDILIERRAKAKDRASYELYGILFNGRTSIDRVDHAPTAGDFSPLIGKKRIASLFTAYDMVVEFRSAWKTEAEAKVVAWEAAQ